METQKRDSRNCNVCNINIDRASIIKHRKKEAFRKWKIHSQCFFSGNILIKLKKMSSPKPLREITRGQFMTDGKQLKQEDAKNLNNPFHSLPTNYWKLKSVLNHIVIVLITKILIKPLDQFFSRKKMRIFIILKEICKNNKSIEM